MRRALRACLPLLLATGCAVGPDWRRPDLALPATHAAPPPGPEALGAEVGWWDLVHGDPVLKALVLEALDRNRDLAAATARLEETRELAAINHLAPDLDATANPARKRALVSGLGPRTLLGNQFTASLSTSWELDFWGRVRRGRESAQAQFQAGLEGRRAVLLSLVGDVVGGYHQLQVLDLKLETARGTVAVRRRSLALVEQRMTGGLGDRLETSQAASALALAEAAVPQLKQAVQAQENLLNLLLGRVPGPVARGRSLLALAPPDLAPGLPSALLERRPDVRQREELLRSANAQVGVATANLFPRFSLTGSLGFQSAELSNLTTDGQRSWSLGGGLVAPLLNGGELRRQRSAAIARAEQARSAYEKAVLSALADAANALGAVATTRELVAAQGQAVAALREAERIAVMRFEGGVSPYLEVLDAQRQLFAAELGHADALGERQRSLVRLYLALGGGWNQPERPPEPRP